MEYVPRLLDNELSAFIDEPQANKSVLLVEGARQVGKSRLVEQALRGTTRKCFPVNLERESRLRSLIDACQEFRDFEQLLRDRLGFGGICDYLGIYGQPVGVVVSLAPYGALALPGGREVANLPAYLLERLSHSAVRR
jgi:hypothetical protein